MTPPCNACDCCVPLNADDLCAMCARNLVAVPYASESELLDQLLERVEAIEVVMQLATHLSQSRGARCLWCDARPCTCEVESDDEPAAIEVTP